jgi:uncharacterized membrane protein (DUF373 family)
VIATEPAARSDGVVFGRLGHGYAATVDDREGRRPPPRPDDEGLPPEPPSGAASRLLVRGAVYGEGLVFAALSLLLFGIAVLVLVRTTRNLIVPPPREAFAETITQALNGVLFVVIVIEVLRTIIGRFQGQGFRLQPFLVIAIVSTVRHILTVAARLSLVGERNGTVLILELVATAGVVLVLVAALVMLRRWARLDEP